MRIRLRLRSGPGVLLILLVLAAHAASAGGLRERWRARRAERQQSRAARTTPGLEGALPAGVEMIGDLAYGDDPLQKLDVYRAPEASGAPVLFMVHGGAWAIGDKRSRGVAPNKVARWVTRGFLFVSVNYRLVPDVNPLEQAQDVARALAFAQARARSWGGDPAKFVLMGHSAGAHLVDVLAADPRLALSLQARPWLGTISLDTAALDVEAIMRRHHLRFYDRAFGRDPAFWKVVSPIDLLTSRCTPMLLVCSTVRKDHPCRTAQRFAARARSLAVRVEVLPEALRHGKIDLDAGLPGAYTDGLEAFLGSLDPALKERFARPHG